MAHFALRLIQESEMCIFFSSSTYLSMKLCRAPMLSSKIVVNLLQLLAKSFSRLRAAGQPGRVPRFVTAVVITQGKPKLLGVSQPHTASQQSQSKWGPSSSNRYKLARLPEEK
jgi:hypothetical protein